MQPVFFATPAAFRKWLARNHEQATELWVGYYRKDSGRKSITWPESVDQALCFGWIDGIRKSIDEESYMIRFTHRKPTSIWSAVNTRRARELIDEGLMQPAGLAAFEKRDEKKTAIYAYESPKEYSLEPAMEKEFRKNKKAWAFFQALPPGYRKRMTHRVISAKQEATRQKRLAELIADCEAGIRRYIQPRKTK